MDQRKKTTVADKAAGESVPTAEDIRAWLRQLRFPLYQLGARISVHPTRLSSMLHGRVALPRRIAARIAMVLAEEEEFRRPASKS